MFLYTGRPAGRQAREINRAGHGERTKKTREIFILIWCARKASRDRREWGLRTLTETKA